MYNVMLLLMPIEQVTAQLKSEVLFIKKSNSLWDE